MCSGLLSKKMTQGERTELYSIWKAFVVRALEHLKSQVSQGADIPESVHEEIVLEGIGGPLYRRVQVRKTEYNLFLSIQFRGLVGLEEYKSLSKAMEADPQISDHTKGGVSTVVSGIFRGIWDYATYPLIEQLSKGKKKFAFDEELFRENFSQLIRFFSSKTILFRYLAPLLGFDSDVGELVLEPRLKIRQMTKEELQDFMNLLKDGGFMPFEEVRFFKFCIELQLDASKHFESWNPTEPELEAPAEEILQVVGSLRLFKPGDLTYNVIKVTPAVDFLHTPGITIQVGHYRGFLGNSYVLNRADLDEFKVLRGLMKDSTIPKVALRRFQLAYDREHLEDRMIDYMIGLEALFLRGGSSEMTHKLSLRVAKLLAGGLDDRHRVYKEVKKLYGGRSAIVHGESADLSDQNLGRVEEILRHSIKQFLRLLKGVSHEELLTRLDLL